MIYERRLWEAEQTVEFYFVTAVDVNGEFAVGALDVLDPDFIFTDGFESGDTGTS